eukprot:TRINITY_DN67812_c0_g1_i1.p1 TRINITY_DN67812_c0_g1~~TRINITY_DN67812_c0_g1_i1.p1  ORF type:complete len:370 (-),score=59.19 TRINITY_DN67812_c0_g1_i1:14-1123(-)
MISIPVVLSALVVCQWRCGAMRPRTDADASDGGKEVQLADDTDRQDVVLTVGDGSCAPSVMENGGISKAVVDALSNFSVAECVREDEDWIRRRGEGDEQFIPRAWGLSDLRKPKVVGEERVLDSDWAAEKYSDLVKSDDREVAFRTIYAANVWSGGSGPGSDLRNTAGARCALQALRVALPQDLKLQSLWDISGDFRWMRAWLEKHQDVRYRGADVVPEIAARLQRRYGRVGSEGRAARSFITADLVCGEGNTLTGVDGFQVIFVREVFQHLTPLEIFQALRCVSTSGAKWLVATNFPAWRIVQGEYSWNLSTRNRGVDEGVAAFDKWRWHAYDLTEPPYSLPKPIWEFADNGKVLGLWSLPLSIGTLP